MDFRVVLFVLSLVLVLIGPGAAESQPGAPSSPARVYKVGFLYSGSRQSALATGRYGAFVDGMRELGYGEGKNLLIEPRFFEGDVDRLRTSVAELIRLKVDVIVTSGSGPAKGVQEMTTTIPIVVAIAFDPVREGLVGSLAHPGGNITGLAALLDDVFPKQVELLKEASPKLARLAVLSKPTNTSHPGALKRIETVARNLGIQLVSMEANTVKDLEAGFAVMVRERAEALVILGDGFFVQNFQHIAALAIKHRLPSTYSGREYPEAGGLISYGPNFSDNYRRVAHYVDRILKGAKPGELPFEQPTRLYLVINLKTAKAMAVSIPPSLLLRADQVIE
jgi:putative tryptophan/tyrosine transport system substrate-binding protein